MKGYRVYTAELADIGLLPVIRVASQVLPCRGLPQSRDFLWLKTLLGDESWKEPRADTTSEARKPGYPFD